MSGSGGNGDLMSLEESCEVVRGSAAVSKAMHITSNRPQILVNRIVRVVLENHGHCNEATSVSMAVILSY